MRPSECFLSALVGIGIAGAQPAAAQDEGVDLLSVGPRDVELGTEDDQTVQATFYPASDAELPPAVILVAEPSVGRDAWAALASELTARGVAVLTLDPREIGEADGDVAQLMPNDIRAGIRFLREREDIDGVRVALVGAALGANAAAVYAVDDHLLSGLGLLSPLVASHGLEAREAIHAYGDRPSILIASEGDVASAAALAILADKAQGKADVVRVAGSSHGTQLLASFKARAALVEWLDDVLSSQ